MNPKKRFGYIGIMFAIHSLLSVTAHGQTAWTLRNPYPTPHRMSAVTWTGSLLVAVGDAGVILTSPDGSNWTNRNSGVAYNLRGVVSSGNTLVAVGDSGCVLTSHDGESWAIGKRLGYAMLNAVMRTDTLFIAFGDFGVLYTSKDGITWTSSYPSIGNEYLTSGVWTGTHAVIIGLNGDVLISSDCINWTVRKSAVSSNLRSIAWNGSKLVALGWDFAVCTSTDGIFWTKSSSSTASILFSVVWTGAQFVAVGGGGGGICTILTSPTGETWTQSNAGISQQLNSVAWTGSQLVAVGDGGAVVTSSDGQAWTCGSSGPECDLHAVASTDSLFVAVGDSGLILTSVDGLKWEKRASGTLARLLSVAWSGHGLVAVGDTVVTSPDGLTWTAYAEGALRDQVSVTWADNQFISVGLGAVMSFSPDGIHWTNKNDSALWYPHQWQGVAWADTQLIVVGNSPPGYFSRIEGSIMQTKDEQTWKELYHNYVQYSFVSWSNKVMFAAADSGRLYSSTNGQTWKPHGFGNSYRLNSLTWTGKQFVVVGNGVFVSPTAEKWSFVPVPYNLNSVAVKGNMIAAVGNGGAIVSSPVDSDLVMSRWPRIVTARPKPSRMKVTQLGTLVTVLAPGIAQGSRMTIRLCNTLGKTFRVKSAEAQSRLILSTADLPAGSYVVSLEYNGVKMTWPGVILKR